MARKLNIYILQNRNTILYFIAIYYWFNILHNNKMANTIFIYEKEKEMNSQFKKKDFEGLTECYGIPLGNSVSRSVTRLSDQIRKFTIISVGTKKIKHTADVWLTIDGSTCANHFGYQAFPTRKDAEEFLHKHQMITNIKNNLNFSKLSYQEVLDLHKKVFIR